LLDELESVLGIHACAVNWPLGMGNGFRGVYDRLDGKLHLFERVPGGAYRAPEAVTDIADPLVREKLPEEVYRTVVEELEILEGAGAAFDRQRVLAGELSPVF